MRDRTEIKQILENAFREEFPNDTVDVSDGYQGNIHIIIVSRQFDKTKTEKEKLDFLYNVIDKTNLVEEEKRLISLLQYLHPKEIRSSVSFRDKRNAQRYIQDVRRTS